MGKDTRRAYAAKEKRLREEMAIRMRPFKAGFVANVTLLAFSLAVFIVDGYAGIITTYLPLGIVAINFIVVAWNAFIELIVWE
jgi:hypothetical protein